MKHWFNRFTIAPSLFFIGTAVAIPHPSMASDFEFNGSFDVQSRYFTSNNDTQNSISFEPEIYWPDAIATGSITAKIFARIDDTDDSRNRFDIRELSWLYVGDTWEINLGIDKVFWGVTESNHLVDIINQTDFSGSPDGEEKLGQPMLQYSHSADWGIIDVFILPYFRPREFPGANARLGVGFEVDNDLAAYESSDEENHTDIAVRYTQTFGNWDIGLSHFVGTNREPKLSPISISPYQPPVFLPYYDQISQTGLSAQVTLDAWLLKLEAITREDSVQDYNAFVGGLEYTFYGILESTKDLGVLVEYNYDSREEAASTPLQDDLFFGARMTFNDVAGTEFLAGVIVDLTFDDSVMGFVEASRRFGQRWRASIDARFFEGTENLDLNAQFAADDYIGLTLEQFF